MTNTPQQQFEDLTKVEGLVEADKVAAVFDQLKSVEPEQLIGRWKGGSFDTGHPAHKTLDDFNWAGKDFKSVNDVDPIMVTAADGSREWYETYGHARLRKVEFRGVVSTAMIYDNFPIIDTFRYISEDTLLGAMDAEKMWPGAGTYFFYLMRIQE